MALNIFKLHNQRDREQIRDDQALEMGDRGRCL